VRSVSLSKDDGPLMAPGVFPSRDDKSGDPSPHLESLTVCHLYGFSTNEDSSDNNLDVSE
jgi:hypothetical protein